MSVLLAPAKLHVALAAAMLHHREQLWAVAFSAISWHLNYTALSAIPFFGVWGYQYPC